MADAESGLILMDKSPKTIANRAGRKPANPIILLTNDDGHFREEIQALRRKLRSLGRTFVVAPDRERSAASLCLSLRRPLRLHRIGPSVWAVEGTPADCVYFALQKLLPRRPDLLISGLNPGPNLGQQDVHYSGTVGAALQGTFLGIPSMAVSLIPDEKGRLNLAFAASVVRAIAGWILAGKLPAGIALNVNIPQPPVKGIKVTKLGWKFYNPEIIEKTDPRGASYYWIGTGQPECSGDDMTDLAAVRDGYISVTPLHTDMTAFNMMERSALDGLAALIPGPRGT